MRGLSDTDEQLRDWGVLAFAAQHSGSSALAHIGAALESACKRILVLQAAACACDAARPDCPAKVPAPRQRALVGSFAE